MKQRTKQDYNYRKLEKNSDSEGETELFVKNKPVKWELPTVDKDVEDGDTLQSLAIRYRCTIADLKRLNNIHRDNEIFAKRTIKVPHHPISLALAGVHVSGRNSPEDNQPSTSTPLNGAVLENTLIQLSEKDTEVNEIIFNSHIVQKPTTKEVDEDEEEAVHLLPQNPKDVAPNIKFNSVDCDISWKALILCVILLIFAVPLIYVFYIAEHPEQYHHGS